MSASHDTPAKPLALHTEQLCIALDAGQARQIVARDDVHARQPGLDLKSQRLLIDLLAFDDTMHAPQSTDVFATDDLIVERVLAEGAVVLRLDEHDVQFISQRL